MVIKSFFVRRLHPGETGWQFGHRFYSAQGPATSMAKKWMKLPTLPSGTIVQVIEVAVDPDRLTTWANAVKDYVKE